MTQHPHTDYRLCRDLEAAMASILREVEKDRDRERHFAQRVKKGLAKVEMHRQVILSHDPGYVFEVKVPRVRRPKQLNGLPRGHFTGIVRKIMRTHPRGSFKDLKAAALAGGMIQEAEVEPVRQAFYQLHRKGLLEMEKTPDGAGVFVGPVKGRKPRRVLTTTPLVG